MRSVVRLVVGVALAAVALSFAACGGTDDPRAQIMSLADELAVDAGRAGELAHDWRFTEACAMAPSLTAKVAKIDGLIDEVPPDEAGWLRTHIADAQEATGKITFYCSTTGLLP